jgi:hypothetical protein
MLAAGVLLVIVGIGPMSAGIAGAVLAAQRDDDGFLRTPATSLSTGGYALTSPVATAEMGMSDAPREVPGQLLTIEARVVADGADRGVFIGVGPAEDVADYLDDVAHSEISDIQLSPGSVRYRNVPGDQVPSAPADQAFWAVSDTGAGSAEIRSAVRSGDWVVVVMNEDASPFIEVSAQVGARSDLLVPVAGALIFLGALLIVIGAALVVAGAVILGRSGIPTGPRAPGTLYGHPTRGYPAHLHGSLAPNPSRALWLVKWLLLIPHFFILLFLWVALAITTVVAWFAILITGRYPRALFEFNVGVLRWSWRVAFYGYSALGTDEYPPFTLARTGYPADFDVDYPEHLSRGLVIVKSWLLAIPHLIVVSILTGGASWTVWNRGESSSVGYPALLGILVLVAAIILLFTRRYQTGLFDLIMGVNRWNYRVVAYVLLMRDEYPPFRLDQGPDEPESDRTSGPATDRFPSAP